MFTFYNITIGFLIALCLSNFNYICLSNPVCSIISCGNDWRINNQKNQVCKTGSFYNNSKSIGIEYINICNSSEFCFMRYISELMIGYFNTKTEQCEDQSTFDSLYI